jgi:conjugative transfer signal peptidase TraF
MTSRVSGWMVHNTVVIAALCCALATCVSIAGALGIRVNLTGSIPVGIYQVMRDPAALKRGDIVLVCLPEASAHLAHARGYIPGGGSCAETTVPVGKIVMALPGDTVVVASTGLSVNGRGVAHSRSRDRDRNGRSLPRVESGQRVVAPGSLWLVGESSLSFDSRYIGPVPVANVISRVRLF